MNKVMVTIAVFIACHSVSYAESTMLHAGDLFTKARTKLYAQGWRPDPLAHAAAGEYMGLDRQMVQNGYYEVDYCSVGKSFCVFQYIKGEACLRLHTQGEQIPTIKLERWSNDCRERGRNEMAGLLPAEVRYMHQWRKDCKQFGQCEGADRFLLKLKKKYARNSIVMKALKSDGNADMAKPNSEP